MPNLSHQSTSESIKKLQNSCELFSKTLNNLFDKYSEYTKSCPEVSKLLRKACNRSKEYVNGSFIVLVVGPVKSGKSTLVNLIADEYVSPTHFLECTVRPSIISQKSENDACAIDVYTSHNQGDKIEQIDSIIDYIRKMDDETSLENISKTRFDLTPQNIKDKVELGLKESLSSETLVTSITTPGGKLMKQDVFIVDMPGFDGEYANIDNPIYDTIAQRADLIIFVQSSNSAISKVAGQFLKKLSENNKDVPVCLIHNIFDSSWWRSKEERNSATSSQKEFAIKEIRKQGFNIDEEQCFSINLGKVEDGRKNQYSGLESLKSEVLEYERIEETLYNRIINRRDVMRLKVCLSRTLQQLDKTILSINEELDRRKALINRFEQVDTAFANEEKKLRFLLVQQSSPVNYNALKDIVRNEAQSQIALMNDTNNHNNDNVVKGIILNFIDNCEKSVSASFGKNLSLNQKEDELYSICKQKINEIMTVMVQCGESPLQIVVDKTSIEDLPDISLLAGINLELLIPHKPVFAFWGGHSAEDVVSYINKASERFVGSEDSNNEGYIDKEGGAIKPILEQVNQLIDDVRNKYEKVCNDYWKQSREKALNHIIDNKKVFDLETDMLSKLRQDLLTMREHI